ncbi:MAG: ISNCY family transposase [Ramlibacter sp.]
MSLQEVDRYAVIEQVIRRAMRQADAALWLGVSVRQVKRLVRAVRTQGTAGVVSRRRGAPSNRRIEPAQRAHYLELVREHYGDFGPTLAAEYLAERHGFTHSAESLRGWMIAAGLWKPKRVRQRAIHSPRERRAALGELIQIDGSPHAWFEKRAAKCCLIAFIDDATGRVMAARFYPVESTAAYLDSLQRYVSEHGRPLALYSDRHSIFTKHDPEDPVPTQFERAVGELNIESILAYTPQAKGRVERLFQTLQDRLVKALRLDAISSIETANLWLAGWLPRHNARFARAPACATDAHRPWHGSALQLRCVCALHYERSLSKTLTCQFKGQFLVVLSEPTNPRYGLRNKRVRVVEHLDGEVQLWREEQLLPLKSFERHQHLAQTRLADDKMVNTRVDAAVHKEAQRLRALVANVQRNNPNLQASGSLSMWPRSAGSALKEKAP